MTMKRRDALKTLGAMAGAATMSRILPGCGGGSSGPEGITTIVAMMMENRSFNHFMGSRTLIEGKTGEDGLVAGMMNPDRMGNPIGIYPATTDTLCVIDPPHGWDAGRVDLNGGACDGFVISHQNDHDSDTAIEPMQYLLREHVPTSYALADAYTLCNRWFCSVLGPTYPNRYYWHSAQSNGIMDNTIPATIWLNLYDRLNAAGIDWAYYYGDVPVLSLLGSAGDGHIKRFKDFATDCAAGTLPPVVYIDPSFSLNDDHPPHHLSMGQQLIGAVYTALATSPQWKNILFCLTYDENGGFFDHVAPPTAADDLAAQGFDQLGFRVPTLVMGPYVKQGLSSVVYDHTSVLRHIENMFALDPLTARDAAATDLTDCLDMARLMSNDWQPAVDVPLVMMNESDLPPECLGSGSSVAARQYHHDILEWADAHPEAIAGYDERGNQKAYLETIHEMLARHGAGIRWGR
jgi:phospholipase C